MKVNVMESPGADTVIQLIVKENADTVLDFEGNKNEVAVRYSDTRTIIYCGLGERDACNDTAIRSAAAAGTRKANDLKRTKAAIVQPAGIECSDSSGAALLEGALLGSYTFTKHMSGKKTVLTGLEISNTVLSKKEAQSIHALCEGVFYARDLVNDNAHEITPQQLAKEAQTIASKSPNMSCTILTEKEIRQKGLGLLYAVGQGSPTPPRLIIMHYKGAPKNKKTIAIVGKGITFDSGGNNLKPSGSIETMRSDMAGAATILGTMKALTALKPPVNVIGVVSAAHNAIDGTSFIPGDIYTSYSGKKVEVLNTDAEGRLILADAISYCVKQYRPTEIVDMATLTGAMVVALGETISGVFSNNDALAAQLVQSGEKTGERLWRMPLFDEHRESLKSDLADIRNISKWKRSGSSITAAAFIESFAENTPWAHIDIAGTAFNEGENRGEIPKFGTGFGVRLLVDYLLNA